MVILSQLWKCERMSGQNISPAVCFRNRHASIQCNKMNQHWGTNRGFCTTVRTPISTSWLYCTVVAVYRTADTEISRNLVTATAMRRTMLLRVHRVQPTQRLSVTDLTDFSTDALHSLIWMRHAPHVSMLGGTLLDGKPFRCWHKARGWTIRIFKCVPTTFSYDS